MMILVAAVCFTALVWAPGSVLGRAAGLRGWSVLAVAPGLSYVLVAVTATAMGALGWHWGAVGPPVLAVVTAVAAAVLAALSGALARRDRRGPVASGRGEPRPPWARGPATLPVAGAVLVCAVAAWCAFHGGAVVDQWPAQTFDATFHLNAVAAIRQGGDASLLGGLRALYQGNSIYYPSVWHALVALLPGGAVPATNGAVLALAALVWPTCLAGMLLGLRGLLPSGERLRGWAVALTVLLGGGATAFVVLTTSLTVWPYALSVTALPGVLLLAHRVSSMSGGEKRPHGSTGALAMVLALTAAGAVAAHGAGAFNLGVLGLAWFPLMLSVLWGRAGQRSWARAARFVLLGLIVLAAAGTLWVMRESLASVLGYQRPSGGWAGLAGTLGQALADLPMYGGVWNATALLGVMVGALTLMGAWIGWRTGARRWVGMWVTALVLTVMVGGPAWWGRQLGSPWYLQKARLAPLVLLPSLFLMCLAWSRLLQRCRPRAEDYRTLWRPVALGLVALLIAGGRQPLQQDLVASVYDPARIQYGTVLTATEIRFFHQLASQVPEQAVVVGAPSRGASLLWALEGVEVVYPVRSAPWSGSPQERLAQAWPASGQEDGAADPGGVDASVWSGTCALLAGLGADYLYTDSSPDAEGALHGQPPLRWDAALATAPSHGVELVAQDGDYALWRITACD